MTRVAWQRVRACFVACVLGMLLAVSLAVSPASVFADADAADDYAIESSKAARTLMLDVTRAGERLVAVGDRGHILYSLDQGQRWQQARVPTRQLLTALYFVDGQRGWAVGHDALILATDDGGLTWRKQHQDPGREAPLLDVWFRDVSNGFAVGAYGMLLETQDGGQRWTDVSERLRNDDQYHLNGIAAIKGGGLFVVGEQGSLWRSADAGASWQAVESPYTGSWFGVIGTAQLRTLLVYGLRGNRYRSQDFGDSWQQVELSGEQSAMQSGLAGATLLDNGELVLVGSGGTVLRSQDAGRSFSVYMRPDRSALSAVVAATPDRLVLAGQGGLHRANADGTPEMP